MNSLKKLKVLGKEDASLQQLQSHRENLQIKEEELHMLLTRSAAIIRRVLRLSDEHPLPVSEMKQIDMDVESAYESRERALAAARRTFNDRQQQYSDRQGRRTAKKQERKRCRDRRDELQGALERMRVRVQAAAGHSLDDAPQILDKLKVSKEEAREDFEIVSKLRHVLGK
jgi:hypothetical protein